MSATGQFNFRKAERSQGWLKLAIEGVSGAGKTYSSLLMMRGLCGDGRILMIDTENGSGELYSHLYDYDYIRLDAPFMPATACAIIRQAVDAGYAGIIIDSYSHFWKYILAYKEVLDQKNPKAGFANWGRVKPMYEELKTVVLQSPVHICCNLRSKAEYVQTQTQNGTRIDKVGVNPITEPENEYEFTVVFTVDRSNQAVSSKDRTGLFNGGLPTTISEDTGKKLLDWLYSATGGTMNTSAEWVEVAKGNTAANIAAAEAAELGIGTEKEGQGALPASTPNAHPSAFGYSPKEWPTAEQLATPATIKQQAVIAKGFDLRAVEGPAREAVMLAILNAYGVLPESLSALSSGHAWLLQNWLASVSDSSVQDCLDSIRAAA